MQVNLSKEEVMAIKATKIKRGEYIIVIGMILTFCFLGPIANKYDYQILESSFKAGSVAGAVLLGNLIGVNRRFKSLVKKVSAV